MTRRLLLHLIIIPIMMIGVFVYFTFFSNSLPVLSYPPCDVSIEINSNILTKAVDISVDDQVNQIAFLSSGARIVEDPNAIYFSCSKALYEVKDWSTPDRQYKWLDSGISSDLLINKDNSDLGIIYLQNTRTQKYYTIELGTSINHDLSTFDIIKLKNISPNNQSIPIESMDKFINFTNDCSYSHFCFG